jgi:hypothetical protein
MFENDVRQQWFALREIQSAQDTALAAFGFTDWPSSGGFDIRENLPDAVYARIAFFGSDAENEALTSYKLYGRNRGNGPIVLAATGGVTLGAQTCLIHPITGAALTNHFWGDTITNTAGLTINHDFIIDTTNDRIAELIIPLFGLGDFFMEFNFNTNAKMGAIITGLSRLGN